MTATNAPDGETAASRRWSWAGARRTAGYSTVTAVLLGLPLGFLLVLALREWSRYELWSSVRPIRSALRHDYRTPEGRSSTFRRLITSAPGQAFILQALTYPLSLALIVFGAAATPMDALSGLQTVEQSPP